MSKAVIDPSPKITFSPAKIVHEKIRVDETDLNNRQHKPPFEMMYFELQPGDKTPKDRHEDVEIWIIMSGKGRLIYDELEYHLQPRDIVHFEPQKFHQVFNIADGPLLICSLAWIEA